MGRLQRAGTNNESPKSPLSIDALTRREPRKAGRTHVKLGRVFRFEDIVEAHRAMEDNTASGKLVVVTD